jgi:hypothetical protein
MTEIKSHEVDIKRSCNSLFVFLSDLNNLQQLMPEQVSDWKSTATECSFQVKGLAKIALKIEETQPDNLIVYGSSEKMPFKFRLKVFLTEQSENLTKGSMAFEAELNPMMKMMVEKPLKNFITLLADKMPSLGEQ